MFKQNNNQYRLYKVNKNDLNKLFYISLIPTLDVTINDDFIYYIYENKLYFYSDDIGLKSILEDNELEFNDTIKYYIY